MPPWYTGPDPLNLGGAGDAVDDAVDGANDLVPDGAWYGGPDIPNFEGDLPGPDDSNSDAAETDGLGWWPQTGPILPQGPVIPQENGPWFPGLDQAIGGAADGGRGMFEWVGETGGGFVGGVGRHSGIDDTIGGAGDMLGGAGDWFGGMAFKFALLGGALFLAIVLIVVVL